MSPALLHMDRVRQCMGSCQQAGAIGRVRRAGGAMKLADRPERDALCGEYRLGTLRGARAAP